MLVSEVRRANVIGTSQIIQNMLPDAEYLKKIAKNITRVSSELDNYIRLRPNSELDQT